MCGLLGFDPHDFFSSGVISTTPVAHVPVGKDMIDRLLTPHPKKRTNQNQSTMRFAAALLLPLAATTAFAPNAVPVRAHTALEAFWEKVSVHGV